MEMCQVKFVVDFIHICACCLHPTNFMLLRRTVLKIV